MTRRAGILLHPTSLPGRFAIGDVGPGAERFLEWAAAAGQTLWQVLPLGPTGGGHSPYTTASAFAGNPLLISPERLVEDGLLAEADFEGAPAGGAASVDFESAAAWKESVLRRAYERFAADAAGSLSEPFEAFRAAPEQASWLSDWSFYAALKRDLGGRSWLDWEPDLSRRDPDALRLAAIALESDVRYEAFLQFLFFRQWEWLRRRAREVGVAILGDMPIYVAMDSADVWARPELFALDEARRPVEVSGVPPDYFSATGQLWGNPLYDWKRMEREGWSWWIDRIRATLRTCDMLRIDHFRAFAAYWAVPAGDATALNGRWRTGPGRRLFEAARRALGGLPILAEDLGMITQEVKDLLASIEIPGMKVLQFAFYGDDSEYLPHNHPVRSAVYTATHDNDTARGWYAGLKDEERRRVWDYLGNDGREIEWALIRAAYASVAETAVVPMQDVLGLGGEARMNTPAAPGGNWKWRAGDDAFRGDVAERLKRMVALAGRVPVSSRGA
ncbi:MAG TPA: 4-alpha-glucanotransferase [Thermoanaerobaculia bacterium]|nr:4-alpha-glucanotransferase [Thermoanaerobaculia bacterium]